MNPGKFKGAAVTSINVTDWRDAGGDILRQ